MNKLVLANSLISLAKEILAVEAPTQEPTVKAPVKVLNPQELEQITNPGGKNTQPKEKSYNKQDLDTYKKLYTNVRESWRSLYETLDGLDDESFQELDHNKVVKLLMDFSKVLVDKLDEVKEFQADKRATSAYHLALGSTISLCAKMILTASQQDYVDLTHEADELKNKVEINKTALNPYLGDAGLKSLFDIITNIKSIVEKNKDKITQYETTPEVARENGTVIVK